MHSFFLIFCLILSNNKILIWRPEIDLICRLLARFATGSYTNVNSNNNDQDKLIRKLKYEIEQLKNDKSKSANYK